tara:strand:- start:147 stop:698 length:552 start_codon:yes stop_codon:yes gene_type:complete
MFHKSHSRKDIIDIVKIFKIPLEDPEDFNKKDLSNKLHTILYDVIDGIIPDEHYYGIKNLHDLKEYLIKPNQKKILSVKDKNEIMTTAKLIIQYCKGGYCTEISYFDSMENIYTEARRIAQFGDIPSVRRMCQLINNNPHSNERIFPIISKKIQRDLEIKELTSKTIHHSLSIRIEKIILSFD